MKKTTILFAIILSISFAVPSFGSNRNLDHHFGLSDSCWGVFLAGVTDSSGGNALTAALDSLDAIQTQLDSLQKLIPSTSGKGKAVKDLQAKIKALKNAETAQWKQIQMILMMNRTLLTNLLDSCGREVDTTIAPPDTTVIDSLVIGDIVPNPATVGGTATVTVTLLAETFVSVGIYDQGGVLVKSFTGNTLPVGTTTIPLDLTGLAPGTYFVRVAAGGQVETKMLIIT